MNDAIEVKNLTKGYAGGFCMKELNLNIPKGCIVGLIGENGAGKTTFIKTVLGIIKADYGEVKIFGKDMKEQEKVIKEDIGVVLDDMFFPELLTPAQIHSVMKDTFRNWDGTAFEEYVKTFGLSMGQKIKEMSKGMRKKLEIATALAHHPKLLLLDEPTGNLDPVVRSEILEIFLQFIQDEGNTVLLSTHITSDLEYIADQIIFMDNGELIFHKDRNDILDQYGILKTDPSAFEKIDSSDYLTYRKNRYDYEFLVENRKAIALKYPDYVLDKITLGELMVFMIKGVKL